MPLFQRFVQAGRLVIVHYGDLLDKAAIIVDIVDFNRVIIEGPEVPRQVITLKRLQLTDYCLSELPRGASSKEVQAALKANDVIALWKESSWGKKRARYHAKRNLTDFERFKLMRDRVTVAKKIAQK